MSVVDLCPSLQNQICQSRHPDGVDRHDMVFRLLEKCACPVRCVNATQSSASSGAYFRVSACRARFCPVEPSTDELQLWAKETINVFCVRGESSRAEKIQNERANWKEKSVEECRQTEISREVMKSERKNQSVFQTGIPLMRAHAYSRVHSVSISVSDKYLGGEAGGKR
ncbi:hypothetical protein INR49_008817 [Caranx melampygus]|nr:hypothetical protein INR49_008817 [Caranx melampygus]